MTIEMQAETLTKAYISSYNVAMQKVRNPEFAAQIAGMVVVAINMNMSKQQQEVNPVAGLLAQMFVANRQQEETENLDGEKKK